jgi:hypothetical protein
VKPKENLRESQGFSDRVDAINKHQNSRKGLKSLTKNEQMSTKNAHVPIIRYSLRVLELGTPSGQLLDLGNPGRGPKHEIPIFPNKKKIQSVRNLLLEKRSPKDFKRVETMREDGLSGCEGDEASLVGSGRSLGKIKGKLDESPEDPGSSGPALVKPKLHARKRPPKLDNSKIEENISNDGRSNYKFRDYVSYSTASLGLKVASSARKLCQTKQELPIPKKRRENLETTKQPSPSLREPKKKVFIPSKNVLTRD